MSFEVKFPSVGESITTGILGSWIKQGGEFVRAGEPVAEIETDKVTSEIYAETSGALHPQVEEGATIEVGQVIALIDEKAAAPTEVQTASTSQKAPSQEAPASPTPSALPSRENKEATTKGKAHALLSPAVRVLVDEYGLDASIISGSGKEGRLLKSDVLHAIAEAKKVASVPSQGSGYQKKALSPSERVTRKKMTPLRKRIAERLVSAQQDAAVLTTFNEVDMSHVMNLRKRFQERFVAQHDVKLGFMSFFVQATIYALQSVPSLNAQIDGEDVIQNHFYDIGVAISTNKGLLVPVIRHADQMTLAEIEQEIIHYAQKARQGKITLPDLEGGVFTLTNGGIFGSMLSTPLLNPPQSGILGMHAINERPVAINGRVEIRPMMYLALTYDHRLVDGREAVTFLIRIKEFIESPSVALLGF